MSRKRKNSFADRIIILCLTVSLVITAAVLSEYHRLAVVLPAGVVTALLGLWGGELLIVCIRQIFGADIVTKFGETKHTCKEETEI